MRQRLWIAFVLLACASMASGHDSKPSGPPVPPPEKLIIEIDGALLPDTPPDRTTELSLEDLATLPQEEVHVGSNQQAYQGVALSALLERGGMKWEKNCSPTLASYVLIEAVDGYRALFALPEIHPAYQLHKTILALQADGKPLKGNEAPWRLIEEREKFGSRGVRQVRKITVRMPRPTP